MASSKEFANFVADQVHDLGDASMRRMFGEYFIYIDARPILLICDHTVYVRTYPEIEHLMTGAAKEEPFPGANPGGCSILKTTTGLKKSWPSACRSHQCLCASHTQGEEEFARW